MDRENISFWELQRMDETDLLRMLPLSVKLNNLRVELDFFQQLHSFSHFTGFTDDTSVFAKVS